jgi:hypothetical protein
VELGTATCTTSVLTVGCDTIEATYSGDANHNGSTGTLSQTVNPASSVTLSPTSLSFGSITVGSTTTAKTVTLKNTGTSTLDISSATTSGDFAISASTCAIVPVGKECKVQVNFSPTQLGALTGTLSISDNAPDSPQTVSLSGTGIADATLTPVSETYPTLAVGESSPPRTFTLTNKEAVPLDNIQITTSGDFAVVATSCTGSLAAKSNCWISVTFTPTAAGTRTGQLSVSDSGSGSPQTSNLTGTGK